MEPGVYIFNLVWLYLNKIISSSVYNHFLFHCTSSSTTISYLNQNIAKKYKCAVLQLNKSPLMIYELYNILCMLNFKFLYSLIQIYILYILLKVFKGS